ncbi:Trp biosynthesis-associated membrane protein [Pseudonocardia spinosispora]|uniref:Trp biosynthesis-associated membrane protein n=1 Tax=Pseudonocardia spinosispora TaxID=103441 RepID=UPI00040FCC4E|nr:Trp biosynthesis-associated membrane protein [Pseudonocardia spinosispora]
MSPPRRLAVTVLALLVTGLLLWVSSGLVWVTAEFTGSLRGPVTVRATGADLAPELGGVALLAVAAVAALVATSGWARRIVGVVVAAVGAWVGWLSASWLLGPVPVSFGAAEAPPVGSVPAGPAVRTAAPLVPLGVGVLLLLTGVAIVLWARDMPGMGRRYAAPSVKTKTPARDSDWWEALDAGDDPTARSTGTDPGPKR